MFVRNLHVYVLLIIIKRVCAVRWASLKCSIDHDVVMPEGPNADIGRFPWLGVVQHDFVLHGGTKFAVTSGVLIHPEYAIAPADDIARIPVDAINNTKFVIWRNNKEKYALGVSEYILHPEYSQALSYSSLALLHLEARGVTGRGADPMLPVCLPVHPGAFTALHAVKIGDDGGKISKETYKMDWIRNSECHEFYERAKLDQALMAPVVPICAVSSFQIAACVWDSGVALIANTEYASWILLGFGMRGPGCGAPARFVYISHYIPWFDEVIVASTNGKAYNFRRHNEHRVYIHKESAFKYVIYDATSQDSTTLLGQCDKKDRGRVLYKDESRISVDRQHGEGSFRVSVMQLADVKCAVVLLDVTSRSNANIWHEHHCVKDTGEQTGDVVEGDTGRACFADFTTESFIQFRFTFSYNAKIIVIMYGHEMAERRTRPDLMAKATYDWRPTPGKFNKWYYMPN